MKEIYLDNAATTKPYDEVVETVAEVMRKDYGNPSSLHTLGMAAEAHIKKARKTAAQYLKAGEKEIYFTSGGTEGDNMAILGAARAARRRGTHLITTKMEHPAVLSAFQRLEDEGFSVTYLPVNEVGLISPEAVLSAIREDTVLISLMQVNNEIGTTFPVEAIGKRLKEAYPKVLFHVDGVQGFGKYPLHPGRCGVDFYTASAHKLHGPKGVGLLYAREGARMEPVLFGGGQEKGMRSGTENVPGIAGFCRAMEIAFARREEKNEALAALKRYFTDGLKEMDGVHLNGPQDKNGAAHVVSASFAGVASEVLLHALEEAGIFVSAGSACASHHAGVSKTIEAIRLPKALRESVLRFSFSDFTTKAELAETLEVIREKLPCLRRFTRR